MRLTLPIARRMADALRKRDWFGVAFELLVVVLGVALGFEVSRWSAAREEREYRGQILASLDRTLADYEDGCDRIHTLITTSLEDFKRRTSAGERPRPPIIAFPALERPPTRAWEALVATGAARSLDPELLFRLALHFDRADSFGDKYQRYNLVTEQQIVPYENDSSHFYGMKGELKPVFAAHIQQLRDLLSFNDQMGDAAGEIRRSLKLRRASSTNQRDLPVRT